MSDAMPTPEGQAPVSAPSRPETYTHLTVTFREPLAGADAVTGTVTIELEEIVYEEDVLDEYPLVEHPVREKGSGGCEDTSDVTVHRDDVDEIYVEIQKALEAAGRKTSYSWYQTGDIMILAFLDAAGEIQTNHTYETDGSCYLVDVDWVDEWRFHNA